MHWIFGNYVRGRGAAGLLIVRLVFGLGIMLHGWQKIQSPGGPFGWMNAMPDAHVPAFFQGLATLAEFGGGLGIILGLLTPLAALGLICNMLVALFMCPLAEWRSVRRRRRPIVRARRTIIWRWLSCCSSRGRGPGRWMPYLAGTTFPPRQSGGTGKLRIVRLDPTDRSDQSGRVL